ncbi:MAG: hypothetical protein P4L28_11485 [Paludibacteraceae bacterium]|nr:hypothetical protein [Paludibacteraceae bacterium]
MNKVALNFISYPPPKKIVFYRYIIIQMSRNTSFPLPDVPLVDLATGVEALETAYLNAEERSSQQTNLLSKQEQAIDELFKMLAYYVEETANGKKNIIISSGFHPETAEFL